MKLAIICSDEKGLERRLFRSIPKHSISLHPRFPLLYLTRVQKRFVRRYSGEQFVILIFLPRKGGLGRLKFRRGMSKCCGKFE